MNEFEISTDTPYQLDTEPKLRKNEPPKEMLQATL